LARISVFDAQTRARLRFEDEPLRDAGLDEVGMIIFCVHRG
jgi:hypothetical protein